MLENKNKRINYKNIFISYLDKKGKFNEKDVREFFRNLIKNYDNKIHYSIVGQKGKRFNVLLMLDKRPHFSNIKIFNLVLEKKKGSNANTTLEPINIEKIISPQIIYEDIISQSERVCEDGIPNFIKEISSKTRKEQNEEYNDYMIRIKREFDEDEEMSVDEVSKLIFGFLYKTKNYMVFERSSTVIQAIKNNFRRVRKLQDFIEFKSFNSFDLANHQIQFMMNFIYKGIEALRNGNRYPALIVEGITGIGKTQFWFSFLHKMKIVFNYMKRRLNYSRKRYDDKAAEVDIYDDFRPKYLIEQDLLETIFTSQVGHTVETAKHEPDREILKMKLNIFLCNPHKSFEEFFKTLSKEKQDYLKPNVIFIKLTDQKLFTIHEKDKEEEKETKKKGKKK